MKVSIFQFDRVIKKIHKDNRPTKTFMCTGSYRIEFKYTLRSAIIISDMKDDIVNRYPYKRLFPVGLVHQNWLLFLM